MPATEITSRREERGERRVHETYTSEPSDAATREELSGQLSKRKGEDMCPVENVVSEKAPEAVGPYPHAKRVGDFLFVSGIGPRQKGQSEIPGVTFDTSGKKIGADVAIQTRAVFENIRVILENAGLTLKNIIDVQVFLTDMSRDFKIFNSVYAEYFNAKNGPTRTTVGVTALPTPIDVEIKVIASYLKQEIEFSE
jgi:2-aminomuconate deaminase